MMHLGNLRLHCYNTTTKFKKFISFIKLEITSQLEMISSKVKNNNNNNNNKKILVNREKIDSVDNGYIMSAVISGSGEFNL